ncbi:HNH endonuclease [PVC group bacterium]|nr:HNH endonuclease [PVC group bacterium]
MPVRVLSKHNVVEKKGDLVLLTVGKLSLEERSQIVMLCEQSMQEFIQRKGVHIWDFRYVSDPVPGNARFQALKRANHRCDLCGVKQDDENYEERLPLHVDHIKPRSKGGSNELDNLQVLCRKCNLGKSDRDDTDFR